MGFGKQNPVWVRVLDLRVGFGELRNEMYASSSQRRIIRSVLKVPYFYVSSRGPLKWWQYFLNVARSAICIWRKRPPSYITQLKPLPPSMTSSRWPTAPDALTTAMTPRQASFSLSFHSSALARLYVCSCARHRERERETHTHGSVWRSQTWLGSCGLVLRGSTDWTLCLSGGVKNKTRERVWLALYQC